MAKIDHERPKYEGERVRPDSLDYDLLSMAQEKSIPQYIRKRGLKWCLLYIEPNGLGETYGTISIANRIGFPAYCQKIIIGNIFRREEGVPQLPKRENHNETVKEVFATSSYPQIPLILYQPFKEIGAYIYPTLVRFRQSEKGFENVEDYLENFYVPVLRGLIKNQTVTVEHRLQQSEITDAKIVIRRGYNLYSHEPILFE